MHQVCQMQTFARALLHAQHQPPNLTFRELQRMSHPVRRLCPYPDIALERICLLPLGLGLPASRPVEAPASNQHGAVPLTPRRSCKNQSLVRKLPCAYLAYDNKTLYQMNNCIYMLYYSLHQVCKKVFTRLHSVCIKSAYLPCAYLAYENKKVRQMHTFVLVCMIPA